MQNTSKIKKRPDGIKIFFWIIEAVKAISGTKTGCNSSAAILALLYSFCADARRKGACSISQSYIASCIGCSNVQKVGKALAGLEKAGYIKIERRNTAKCEYTLTKRLDEYRKADETGAFLYVKPWMLDACNGFTVSCALLAFVYSCRSAGESADAMPGLVWASHMDFARKFGCSRRTIYNAFSALRNMGYISQPANGCTIFDGVETFQQGAERDIVESAEGAERDIVEGAERDIVGCRKGYKRVQKGIQNNNTENINENFSENAPEAHTARPAEPLDFSSEQAFLQSTYFAELTEAAKTYYQNSTESNKLFLRMHLNVLDGIL